MTFTTTLNEIRARSPCASGLMTGSLSMKPPVQTLYHYTPTAVLLVSVDQLNTSKQAYFNGDHMAPYCPVAFVGEPKCSTPS